MKLKNGKFSVVVDLTWGGWLQGRKTAKKLDMPYIRMQAANHLFLKAASDFMWSLNMELVQFNHSAVDAALIFEDEVRILKAAEHNKV